MATQKHTGPSPTTVSNVEGYIKDTLPTCFLCNGRHPANYKGFMVYRELVSARNRNSSLHKHRSNIRNTLIKQQEVSNNAQNNTLSYAQAVTGIPADLGYNYSINNLPQ
jgi:hypothetical protein